MIYKSIHSGLGNALFQIAAIWTLAKDNDDELCLLFTNRTNVALSSLGRGNMNIYPFYSTKIKNDQTWIIKL